MIQTESTELMILNSILVNCACGMTTRYRRNMATHVLSGVHNYLTITHHVQENSIVYGTPKTGPTENRSNSKVTDRMSIIITLVAYGKESCQLLLLILVISCQICYFLLNMLLSHVTKISHCHFFVNSSTFYFML